MNQWEKSAILSRLAEQLRAQGSWCEEFELHKADLFLQDLLGVPLGVEFLLYKQSPWSFDLEDDVGWMLTKRLLEKDYRSTGYGPGLKPTPSSAELRARHPDLQARYGRQIDFVARTLGKKVAAELESLATAFFVTRKAGAGANAESRADRVREVKPRLSHADALAAVQEFDRLADEARHLRIDTTAA